MDLFAERGYSAVGLSTIVAAAKVTTGAFYYHFDSKEAVAMAIIGQGWPKVRGIVDQYARAGQPGIETVIEMIFAVSDLMLRDNTVGMGQHFNLAFSQLSDQFLRESENRAASFISTVESMIPATDLRDDITAEQVGTQIWMNVTGCHILSSRMRDSAIERLAQSWRILLRASVPADALPALEQVVERTAAQYD